jgi:menaquinone-dependent protoporphyrinogen oxidase
MKCIIIYTTKYGSVEKAAKRLESKMDGEVRLVNIMKEQGPVLDEYDCVILGGSIYAGKVQKKLTDYMTKNISFLLKKKVGLFICAGQPEPVRSQELQASFPPELFEHAAAKDVFGYEYQVEKMNFFEKLMLKAIAGVKSSKSSLADDKIDAFAKTICANKTNKDR